MSTMKQGSRSNGCRGSDQVPGEQTSTSQYARARAEALALKQRVIAKFDFVPAGLQELNLRGNMLGDRGIVLLASVLEQDRMIRVLDLARTGFGEIGAVALGAAMENMVGRCMLTPGFRS